MKKPRTFKNVYLKLPKPVTKRKTKPFTVTTANIKEVFNNLSKSIKAGGNHVDLGKNAQESLEAIRVFEINRKQKDARRRRAAKRIDHPLTVMGIPTFSMSKRSQKAILKFYKGWSFKPSTFKERVARAKKPLFNSVKSKAKAAKSSLKIN